MNIITLTLGALGTNCYIAADETTRRCAVIDPADDAPSILRSVSSHGYTLDKVLLTHTHFDHFGALNQLYSDFEQKNKPEVCVGSYDRAGLMSAELNLSLSFTGFPINFEGEVTCLFENDKIQIGDSVLKVIETPGHTPGSICFYDEKGGSLFSGDTVFAGSIGRTDFPGGSYSAIISSLKKLLELDAKTVIYPGHGARTTVEYERMTNPYFTR